MCTDCDEITQGIPGYNGWSPTFETVVDAVNLDGDGNSRVVLRLTGWIGGEGPTPTTYVGQYLTTGGYTATLASATNIRGARGAQGIQGIQGIPGPAGNSGTDSSGSGAPVTPGSDIGDTYLDTDTGDIYTWDGSTWVLTDVSPVNPTNVLALNISTIAKQCMIAHIGGNTLEDYLAGIIDYVCDIGGGGSSPTYDTQVVFESTAYSFTDFEKTDIIGIIPPAQFLLTIIPISTPLEGVTKFTVPAGVTLVQFELYAGGYGSSNTDTANALIMRSDGSNYYYAVTGEPAPTILGSVGGYSNCPVATSGVTGGAGDGVLLPGNGGAAVGPLAYNVGTNGATFNDGGTGSGAYGKVTLSTTPGEIYYIYATNNSGSLNQNSKVIVSYNA